MSDITCSFGFGSGKFWKVSNILPEEKDPFEGTKLYFKVEDHSGDY